MAARSAAVTKAGTCCSRAAKIALMEQQVPAFVTAAERAAKEWCSFTAGCTLGGAAGGGGLGLQGKRACPLGHQVACVQKCR